MATPVPDPFERFRELYERACALPRTSLPEPTAFALGTVNDLGQPSVRMVLLKSFDARGFVFYTNYQSRKGHELFAHPLAAMCFHWQPLEVQVRIEGTAVAVTPEEGDAYFDSRPHGSQIGAWASLQSQPIAREGDLEARVAEFEAKYASGKVPRPPHWSGFRIHPLRFEFWKNMPSRLHERHLYSRESTDAGSQWRIETLYP
jgi:pyridoxamine 5'-phosphate oxidase